MWGENAGALKNSPRVQEDLKQIVDVGERITEEDKVIMEKDFTFEKALEVGYVVECGTLTTGALIGIIVGPTVGCCCCIALIVAVMIKKRRDKQAGRGPVTVEMDQAQDKI